MEEQQQQCESTSALDSFKQFIRLYYWKPSNIFHTLQHVWNFQISSLIELWFPYYFLCIGFQTKASLILVAYSISFCFSSPIFEFLIIPFQSYMQVLMVVMFLLNIGTIFTITLLQEAISQFYIYLGLSVLSAFLLSGPRCRIYSEETNNRVTRGNKEFFFVISAIGFINQFVTGIDMIIIGCVMQSRLKNFLYVILALSILAAANQIFRQLVWEQDYSAISKEDKGSKQNANDITIG